MSDTFTYSPTAAELRRVMWRTRRPLWRLITETVLLLLLGVPALVAVCTGSRESGTLLIGVTFPLLAAAVWLVPFLSFRREAAELAARPLTVQLTVSEDAIAAGGASSPLTEADLRRCGDLLIWQAGRGQAIVIPQRAVSEAAWALLCETAS